MPESAAEPPSALLDPVRLAALLGPLARRFDVDAVAACDSTNSRLLARGNAPSGSVVVADRQSAGRGRRGRQWVSDPARSLTFSLLWRFARPGAALAGLSLAVGVALARALAGRVALKWPNDLLRRQGDGWGKVGGVLVELSGDRASSVAVIGIGLNLLPPAEAVASALPAAGLADRPEEAPERHELLASVLRELLPVLDAFAIDGFAPFADEWRAHHAFAGCQVRIEEDGRVLGVGRCLGADADGALLLEADGRPVRWISGDVSLRPA